MGLGQTTWKPFELGRGLEADLCFYFDPNKLAIAQAALARESNDIRDYPDPDLAVEVDLSPSKIDRDRIYEALRVAEICRFRGGSISIEQLAPDGSYVASDHSRSLRVRTEEINR
jgi:Uma2 family endonuclease